MCVSSILKFKRILNLWWNSDEKKIIATGTSIGIILDPHVSGTAKLDIFLCDDIIDTWLQWFVRRSFNLRECEWMHKW